jgi:predicted thioesterase
LISFQFEAEDSHELIARGTHKLRVIEVERLARKIHSKTIDKR